MKTQAWLLALAGCAAEPDPCAPMCEAFADRYGGCLAEGGADWEAAGYADAEDFTASCLTWAWEMRLIEAELDARGWTDATCAQREALVQDAACEDLAAIDWNAMPSP